MNQEDMHALKLASGLGVLETLNANGVDVVEFAKVASEIGGVPAALADDMAYYIGTANSGADAHTKIASAVQYGARIKQASAAGAAADAVQATAPGLLARGKDLLSRGVAGATDAAFAHPVLAGGGILGATALGAGAAGYGGGKAMQRSEDAKNPLGSGVRNLSNYFG